MLNQETHLAGRMFALLNGAVQSTVEFRQPAKQTEQFTITIEPSNEGGLLKFIWDETEAYASFRIDKK